MAAIASGTLEGTLSKWTNVMKGWQYRFFVLDESAGLLSYYTSKEKMMKGVRRGCVRLRDAVIGIDDQEDNTFTITVDHKTFHFQAQHTEEREKWVRRLEDTIRRHANRSRSWDVQSNFYGGGSRDPNSRRTNLLEIFGRRVYEADAYLQLMIEQTNKIEQRISAITDPEERIKCNALKENASAMLDHIKHSIVSLQIAKNMVHPINGIYNGPIAATSNIDSTKIKDNTEVGGDETTAKYVRSSSRNRPLTPAVDDIADYIEYGTVCDGDALHDEMNRMIGHRCRNLTSSSSSSSTGDVTTAPLGLVVPETSYSSSDGDDDFYDANDDLFTSLGSSPVSCATRGFSLETSPTEDSQRDSAGLTGLESSSVAEIDERNLPNATVLESVIHEAATSSNIAQDDSETIDYDAFYEEEEDTSISMESHGSMISHLLSQVKIGMDLTKVVLPTFILERRSLLEMYADYFAHPDLFLSIVDMDNGRDRILQVCRWYLSAYHAGRKSQVAKKPYNPILGEVFQCHWNINDERGDTEDEHVITDGPVPWCRGDQLTFLAEQVSHHPPISAFYAEHYNKKITFSAYVWTKSKFLGLSIGVHNIGEGTVTLVDRNEEYIVTFPNGYGRSILTVPWIELGGSVEIRCPQTGYYANIEFLTKPFYGGKRNKVTAEIYDPNEKKPFVSIAGEWSGLMEAKWHDKNKTEVFVDVNQIPIFKKQVRPIAEQADHESRRVWKEVTAGLKYNAIERATKAKYEIEQKQREEAKARKSMEEEWDHKHFKKVGDAWVYSKPLNQRLYGDEKEERR